MTTNVTKPVTGPPTAGHDCAAAFGPDTVYVHGPVSLGETLAAEIERIETRLGETRGNRRRRFHHQLSNYLAHELLLPRLNTGIAATKTAAKAECCRRKAWRFVHRGRSTPRP